MENKIAVISQAEGHRDTNSGISPLLDNTTSHISPFDDLASNKSPFDLNYGTNPFDSPSLDINPFGNSISDIGPYDNPTLDISPSFEHSSGPSESTYHKTSICDTDITQDAPLPGIPGVNKETEIQQTEIEEIEVLESVDLTPPQEYNKSRK